MRESVPLQDIEDLRRQQGIDDVELRLGIRELKPGNVVKLTVLTGPATYELLSVRITSIRGSAFRGKVAGKHTSARLAEFPVGAALTFTTAHIHSIAKPALKPAKAPRTHSGTQQP